MLKHLYNVKTACIIPSNFSQLDSIICMISLDVCLSACLSSVHQFIHLSVRWSIFQAVCQFLIINIAGSFSFSPTILGSIMEHNHWQFTDSLSDDLRDLKLPAVMTQNPAWCHRIKKLVGLRRMKDLCTNSCLFVKFLFIS